MFSRAGHGEQPSESCNAQASRWPFRSGALAIGDERTRTALSIGLFATGVYQLGGLVLNPHEMRSAVQAERVKTHDAPHAAQRETLPVFVPTDIFAAVREQAAAPPDRRARRGL
jgi:hypothetical protein